MLGERPVWPGKALSCGSRDGKEEPRLAVTPWHRPLVWKSPPQGSFCRQRACRNHPHSSWSSSSLHGSSHMQDSSNSTSPKQGDPWGLTAVNQLGSPSKTSESFEEAAAPCRAPAHACDFFRKSRCQRQSSGLQDIPSDVTFWWQSTGKTLVTVQIWSPSERLMKQLVLVPIFTGLSIFVTSSKSGWLPARASYVGLGDNFLPIFEGIFCIAQRLSQHPTPCDQILVPPAMAQGIRSASKHTSSWPV